MRNTTTTSIGALRDLLGWLREAQAKDEHLCPEDLVPAFAALVDEVEASRARPRSLRKDGQHCPTCQCGEFTFPSAETEVRWTGKLKVTDADIRAARGSVYQRGRAPEDIIGERLHIACLLLGEAIGFVEAGRDNYALCHSDYGEWIARARAFAAEMDT